MILTCPSCVTRYFIDPAALGDTGRMVRCARCAHTWVERPPADMPKRVDVVLPPDETPPIPPGSNLPAIRQPVADGSGLIGWVALIFVVFATLFSAVMARDRIVAVWPQSVQIYALFGLDNQAAVRGFEFSNVHQKLSVEDGQIVFVVTGEIINLSGETRPVPKFVARLEDAQGRSLSVRVLTPANSRLAPGETTAFTDRLVDPPEGATQITIGFERP